MVSPSKRPASPALQCLVAALVAGLVFPRQVQASVSDLVPRVSLGASGPRIAVLVVTQDRPAALQQGALEGAAEASLERAGRFSVIPVHDALNPTDANSRQVKLEAAREKVKAGTRALDDLDNVKATEAFTQAMEMLKDADLSANFAALIEAWILKAAGLAMGGETAGAKQEIASVVSIWPKAKFSPNFFPPELIKYAAAQRGFAANAKGELLVRTEPPGARVWVDGSYRGVSPVTVAGLSPTPHFVVASQGGYALSQLQTSGAEEALKLASAEKGQAWKKAIADILRDAGGPGRDGAAQALGKALNLEQVLLVLAKKSVVGEQLELLGVRLETKDGHNAAFATRTVNPSDAEALAAFFDLLSKSDSPRTGKDPVHHFNQSDGSPLKLGVGFALLGLGAAALITGGVFGVNASARAADFSQTPQRKTVESQKLKSTGMAFAVVADVSYLVGLAAAGTGAALVLTEKTAGAAGPPKVEAARKEDAEGAGKAHPKSEAEKKKEDEERKKKEGEDDLRHQ